MEGVYPSLIPPQGVRLSYSEQLMVTFLSKVRFKTLSKKHLKNGTSKIIKQWSNGLQNDSKIHQKWSPWEVKKEPGTKIVIKSADLNYNHYLPHFSHVCNVGKPRILMKTGTKNHQKSMPGAWLRNTLQKVTCFLRKVPKTGS